MAGMGIFPDPKDLHSPQGKEAAYRIADIDDLLDRSEVNYRDHREILDHIPARRGPAGLQVYFW
jgi:hypothetical protein